MSLNSAERVLRNAILADCCLAVPIIGLGFMSGAASAMSEAIRGMLLFAIDIFSFFMFLAVNRRRFSQFEFGLEKIQIMVQLAIALAMCFSLTFIASRVWSEITTNTGPPNYLFSLLFAFFAYINSLVNIQMLRGMIREYRTNRSLILKGQVKNRTVMTVGSVVVTLSCAAVAIPDTYIFKLVDIIGALVVMGVIVVTVVRLLGGGIIALLDAPMEEADKFLVMREVVARYEDWGTLAFLRTRRIGHRRYAEVGLSFDSGTTTAQALQVCREIEESIHRELSEVYVSVYAVVEPPVADVAAALVA